MVTILTSHEILNDLNRITGKEIRSELVSRIGIDCMQELDGTTKKLHTFRKKYLRKLKDLRNKVLGHKYEHAHQQSELCT